jgi:hypothetical protein
LKVRQFALLVTSLYTAAMLHLRCYLTIAILAMVAAYASAQNWNPQGQINSRDVKIEHRNDAGNVVEGTEFVHYEYRVSLRITPSTDDPRVTTIVHCDSECLGKKHKQHDECDQSCDKKCTQVHRVRLVGDGKENKAQEDARTAESARLAKAIGMPGGPDNWSSAASHGIKDLIRDAKVPINFNVPHLNIPCTLTDRGYGLIKYNIEVKGEFWKVGYYMSRGVKTDINQMVSSHDGPVGELWKASRDPIYTDPFLFCFCSKEVKEPVKPPTEVPHTVPGRTPTYSGLGWRDKDGNLVIPEGVKISCTGDTLNKATLVCENTSPNDYVCEISAGTCCVPEDGGTQIMACVGTQTCSCPAGSVTILQISTNPDPIRSMLASKSIKVACTQLAKHEPSSSTKFKLVAPTDEKLIQVCNILDNSTFMASMVDQARIWIYTDHASRDTIAKRTIPGPTEGMYLKALYQLGTQAFVDLTDPIYKPCLDPMLLTAASVGKDATVWYAGLLEDVDSKGGYAASVAKALSGKSERVDARHAAHVALAWTGSANPELVKQGIVVMESGVPDQFRDVFLEEGGADAVRNLLRSAAEASVMKGLELAQKWNLKSVVPSVLGLTDFGASDAIRAKAAEVSTALG